MGADVVAMRVAMLALHRRLVRMVVVAIIVPVGVLVIDRLVGMQVAVAFGQMKANAHGEERRRDGGREPRRPIAHRPCRRSADEGGKREDRSGTTGADSALSKEVKAQTEAVARRADREEAKHRRGAWEPLA